MIGRLRGLLIEKSPPELLIEVGGIGYEVQMPMSCFYHLPALNEEAIIYTHFVVREDAQLLYGFNYKHERSLFREVIKANGVGPKLGLAILSAMNANQFVRCVEQEDVKNLVKIPGVGQKTAERLIVEMKDRLKKWQSHSDVESADLTDPQNLTYMETSPLIESIEDEAVGALVALGYKAAQAERVVAQVIKGFDLAMPVTSEQIIRASLKSLL